MPPGQGYGGALPWEVEEIVSAVAARFDTPLGIHTHEDGGCAVANTLVAVRAGRNVTRAAALSAFVMALEVLW